ncbi:hypothetical protein KY311_02450 [Candidatus Woesearchaeota archaeon]|nr:hypothetical protein [Candidatus Woesearchaeota archaeon]
MNKKIHDKEIDYSKIVTGDVTNYLADLARMEKEFGISFRYEKPRQTEIIFIRRR